MTELRPVDLFSRFPRGARALRPVKVLSRVRSLALLSMIVFASAASAQTVFPRVAETRLVFLGADPAEGLPGPVTGSLGILAFDQLPDTARAGADVMAALLRANAVSTFVSGTDGDTAGTGDLHLVADLTLAVADAVDASTGEDGPASADADLRIVVGDESLDPDAFAARLGALTSALDADARQTAYFRIADPDDLFARALPSLRGSIDEQGFAVAALMVDRADTCTGKAVAVDAESDRAADSASARPPLHYEILAGVPDRTPFGNGDTDVSIVEAARYLSDALSRAASRGLPCAADYSLILTDGTAEPDAVVASMTLQPLIPALDEAVYLETFEALFLASSRDAGAIGAFLSVCRYCPSAAALQAVQRSIGEEARALALETEVWQSIREDTAPERIAIYLENCQLCAFESEAQARLATLDVAAETREAEEAERAALMESDDLDGMLRWLATCVACVGRGDVEGRVAALEADGRFEAEREALDAAIRRHNSSEIAAWIEDCVLCALRDDAETAMAQIVAETEAASECVAEAGLPQLGGPRLLTDIDLEAAEAACDAVLEDYPGSALAATMKGRVALAAGDVSAAASGYAVGMAAGLPQAYGLAAHNLYAPLEGDPDYARAEELALEGHAAGDWFSGEVLVVLYSRELVPGRTASDAFAIALADAEEGNPVAQFFAGFFLGTGTGTAPSPVEAARWYQASVDQGYMHASAFFAEILEEGADGVEADPDRAAALYLDAIAEGDPTALERVTTQVRDRPQPVVTALQEALREAGAFSSRVDGIPGPATVRAVEAYSDLFNDAG